MFSAILAFFQMFEWLPLVNLAIDVASGTMPETVPGLLYDVIQFLAGMVLFARFTNWLSEKSPWKWDDGPGKAFLGFATTALDFATNLSRGSLPAKK